ncbi:MAG TPA: arginine--tRNA ligase [Elusimicrobia bacterium]|nr:arginine--tRNA ligase [Elusimicrobiota bacterium]
MILAHLRKALLRELAAWAAEQGLSAPEEALINPVPPHVPADLSLPYPMQAAKALKRKPLEVATELAARLKDLRSPEVDFPLLESAEPAPPGFINLRLSEQALVWNLAMALGRPADGDSPYGFDPDAPKRAINLEFVSANPTGPVHVASARAATLGDSLSRILRRRGHGVRTEYYVNDVGRQVELLGRSLHARFAELKGKPSEFPEDGYHGEYIKALAAEAPPEAEGWGPPEFSRFGVERMLTAHRRDLEELFLVRFDRWFRESELHDAKALDRTLEKLRKLGRVYEKEGAVWLGSSDTEAGDDKDRVLVRADGRPTYFLSDIAYHEDKLARGFKELIDIWGADHHGYVPRMRAAIEALGHPPGTFHAIIHQLVHLFRGKEAVKMSKRAGEFVTLRELVEEAGLDACRFFFALRSPNAHMNFDIELAKKQSQENPVYYVQYVHARIHSIFREAEKHSLRTSPGSHKEPTARALLVKLAWFPEALRNCERELSPHPLASYLMELSGLFHPFYEQCRVVDTHAIETSGSRLNLCAGVARIIADGLSLLGVSAPEKM